MNCDVIWKWSYGDAKVPGEELFKLAQALGMDTEPMWDHLHRWQGKANNGAGGAI